MSEKSTAKDLGRERRDFFRVSQDVLFDFKLADAFSAENDSPEIEFEDSISLSLVNELRRLDKDSLQTLRLLTEKNRLLGDYLQTLSSKIDLIARHTLFAQDGEAGERPKTRINLSEEGVAFIADRALYKGNYLAVRLIFLPNYVPVVVFAKVIRCEAKDDSYQIAAKFHRLQDKDRQELSRQILKAQVTQKKASAKNK
ncbi:PilZ domain-containing protein [Alteromonadaceae bacterium Bs31]|nr:PilZ domain-containing protein [Alteromonadaceae bacterium Bs31]